jgi:alkylation response protein AidB-like acyl-CoA dehydrogenase
MDRWREEWWYSRTATIYGGSAEVQRSIVADRVLQLPKE